MCSLWSGDSTDMREGVCPHWCDTRRPGLPVPAQRVSDSTAVRYLWGEESTVATAMHCVSVCPTVGNMLIGKGARVPRVPTCAAYRAEPASLSVCAQAVRRWSQRLESTVVATMHCVSCASEAEDSRTCEGEQPQWASKPQQR
jgi:hypothetical protein